MGAERIQITNISRISSVVAMTPQRYRAGVFFCACKKPSRSNPFLALVEALDLP
jgi:hypothetical protein